jgi:fluoroquinolone transport system permease protein
MSTFVTALRWDVVVQARNGFYWATAFVVLVVGGLFLSVPEAVRADEGAWVPAVVAVNLQITTFFFVAGLLLLERDEGTLLALAVSPLTPAAYLATRTLSLTALAGIETIAVVLIAFADAPSWPLLLAGTSALGVIYTGMGAALATRYGSVNALLLPASVVVTLLLLPLLPHFGLAPRALFLVHPVEAPLTLMRAAYEETSVADVTFGVLGAIGWGTVAFWWAQRRVSRLMTDTLATGGR